jgi:hypothetical protein
MKRWMVVTAGVLALAMLTTGVAAAQDEQPTGPKGPGPLGGVLHPYMVEAFADALDLEADELQARLEAGETLRSIAESRGLDLEAFVELRQPARAEALEAAVADGVITRQQADWMLGRMERLRDRVQERLDCLRDGQGAGMLRGRLGGLRGGG